MFRCFNIQDYCDSLSLTGSSLEIAYTDLSSVSSYNMDKTSQYQASASPSHHYKTRMNNQVANSRDIAHEKFLLEGAELQESSLHRQVSFLPLLIHGMCPSLTLCDHNAISTILLRNDCRPDSLLCPPRFLDYIP